MRCSGLETMGTFLPLRRFVSDAGDHFAAKLVRFHISQDLSVNIENADAGRDLIAAELSKPFGDECGGAMHLVEQFGMFVDIPAPGLDIGLQIGDAIDDGHGKSSG